MRTRVVVALAVALLAGAAAIDAIRPPSPSASTGNAPASRSGVLACPHAMVSRGSGWIFLANVGAEPSRASITYIREKGGPKVVSAEVPPGRIRTVAVHDSVRSRASAIIEYAGGELVASHKLWVPAREGGPGVGAEPCTRPPAAPAIAVAGVWTLRAEASLALVNPGTAPADITITLLADGTPLEPVRLRRQVIAPRRMQVVRLGDFAFDKRNIVALISATAGRVVAEALVTSSGGVSLHSGQVPTTDPVSIMATTGEGTVVAMTAVGDDDAGIESRLLGASEQGKAPTVPAALEPGQGARVSIPSRDTGGPAAFATQVAVGSPVVVSSLWRYQRGSVGDRGSSEAAAPALRWAGVTGAMPRGSTTRVVIANPGDAPARVRVRVMGVKADPLDLTIEPGRILARTILKGPGTVGAEVSSDAPVVVGLDGRGRGATVHAQSLLATPLLPPRPAGVVADPRIGITAPLA